jgi:hypothetical protein
MADLPTTMRVEGDHDLKIHGIKMRFVNPGGNSQFQE